MPPFWPFQVQRRSQHDYDKIVFQSESTGSSYPPLTGVTTKKVGASSLKKQQHHKNSSIKKSVSFALNIKNFFQHIHVSEFTEQEIANSWYSPKELQTIQQPQTVSCQIKADNVKPKKRSVLFAPTVKQYDYIHVSAYSKEEINQTWYSQVDLHKIHKENYKTIQWMLRGCNTNSQDEQEFCSRGMESKTPVGSRMRNYRRSESLIALEYQYEQWKLGNKVCPNKLAEIYSRNTKQSAHVAWLAAKVDREHSLKYMTDGGCSHNSAMSTASNLSPNTPPMSPAAAA